MNPSHPLDPEELLQHAPWAHRLACSLVGESAAADLVQDTWLRALRRPPRGDRPLRPWLGTVLGNLARDRARGRSRRQAREELGSRSEAVPSAAELTERTESQRLLMEALLLLEPDLRRLVLLRFVEERSAAQIARDLGLSASTVKSRLERGLDELRGRLTEKHGSREAWSLALLPLVRLAPRAGTGVLSTTLQLVTMKLLSSPVALVALLFVLVGGYVAVGPLGLLESGPDREPVRVETMEPIGGAVSTAHTVEEERARRAVVVTEQELEEEHKSSLELATLRVRLVDLGGRSVEGVSVSLGVGRRDFVALSGTNGRVDFKVVVPSDSQEQTVKFTRVGYASDSHKVELEPGGELDLGDCSLHSGGGLRGRVVDELGAPVGGASVFVGGEIAISTALGGAQMTTSTNLGAVRCETNDRGDFELLGLLAGEARISVEAGPRMYPAESDLVEIPAGGVAAWLEIVVRHVPDKRLIEGVIVDWKGQSAGACEIEAVFRTDTDSGSIGGSSDSAGRFQLVTTSDVPHDLTFEPRRGRGLESTEVPGVAPGTHGLRVVLEAGREGSLRVVDLAGAPVEFFAAWIRPEGAENDFARLPPRDRPGGRAKLPIPRGSFDVFVRAPGFFEGRRVGVLASSNDTLIDFVLRRMPGVEGVVRANGEPVGGAEVQLQRWARGRVSYGGLPAFLEGPMGETAISGADGRFRLDLRESGRFVVRISKKGWAPLELGPFDVDPNVGLPWQEVVLVSGGELVVFAKGSSGALVVASRGDCFLQTARVGEEGLVRFQHLMPGPWLARIWEGEFTGGESWMMDTTLEAQVMPSNVELFVGRTSEVELHSDERLSCRLEGALRLGEADLSDWTATLVPGSPSGDHGRLVEVGLGAGGVFRIEADHDGEYSLWLAGPDRDGLRLAVPLRLEGRETEWQLQLKTARLEVASAESRFVELKFHGVDGVEGVMRSYVPAGQPFVFESLPAGSYTMTEAIVGQGGKLLPGEEPHESSIDLEAGGFERIELP